MQNAIADQGLVTEEVKNDDEVLPVSVLVEQINHETERLDQLLKRRIAAYDRALRLQIQSALDSMTEIEPQESQQKINLYSPAKLMLANSKAV